ncbi:hypothetical protein NA78x_000371 [Anatilimnocola sp. NA78]|uniref:hypothetical protein n=1 Tax=Anatilimnocola sp. NA78 TaxID=3415683 RepID=UPI003CE4D03A
MFHAHSVPLISSRRSVSMRETDTSGAVITRIRPAAQVLLKDSPQPMFEGVRAVGDGHFVLAWGGPYVYSSNAVELRTLQGLIDTWKDLGAPLAVCGHYLLANGPLVRGRNASTRIFDLVQRCILVELPLASPFLMSRSGLVFGRLRRYFGLESSPIADPTLSARFPELRALIDADGGLLVCCDLSGKVVFTITEQELAEPYPELTGLALSRDEMTLYYSGQRSVGAVDVSTGLLRWARHFGENVGEHFVCHRQIALSPDETRLAVAGLCGDREPSVRIISTLDGSAIDGVIAPDYWHALLFHGDTLIAGGNGGQLLLIDNHRQRREVKVSSAGINDLAVLGNGILCACNQRQLRFLPLLDDE